MFSFIDTLLCPGPFLIVIDGPAISCSGAWTKTVGSYSCITGAWPQSQHSGPSRIDQQGWCQGGQYILADLKRITPHSLSCSQVHKVPACPLRTRRDPETPETLTDIPDMERLPSETAVIRLHLINWEQGRDGFEAVEHLYDNQKQDIDD